MASRLPSNGLAALKDMSRNELAWALVGAGVSLYMFAKVSRAVYASLFPNVFPGEPNTALLASPRVNRNARASSKDVENATEYDVIIVGTGTAGSVLAARLSENPNTRVLAIESGYSDLQQAFTRIPAAYGQAFGSAIDYNLNTEPQKNAGNRKMYWPRGKCIGGCSAINAMIYNRGAPDDWDEWAHLGNEGWGYKEVQQYMVKAESFSLRNTNGMSQEEIAQHGRKGPWKTGYSFLAPLSAKFLQACIASGIPRSTDFNTDKGVQGTSQMPTFIDEQGQRSSASVAYLTKDVLKRPNLHIAVGQHVTRIIFDETSGSTPIAVGVEMASGANSPIRYLAKAKKEVIVASGAVHSPHVLKLSGIGSAAELSKHQIPVVKDLPAVGTNVSDHIFSALVARTKKGSSMMYLSSQLRSLPALVRWMTSGTGPLTSNIADAAAFIRTADRNDAPESIKKNDLSSGPKSADIEILSGSVAYVDHGRTLPPAGDYFSVGPILLRPESRGTVTLASANPFDDPLIDANYLSTQHDIEVLTYGLKICRQIMQKQPIAGEFVDFFLPKQNVQIMTDEDLKQYIRDTCETLYHPMGSCPMGTDAAKSVVDSRLKVHGVQGLRVVDASIFPVPVACHPCAVVITVAEKAADMIKEVL